MRAPVRRPYSPPERIAGTPWNATADVFSLAAITFELLTGRRPAGLGKEIGTLTAGTPNTWMDACTRCSRARWTPNPRRAIQPPSPSPPRSKPPDGASSPSPSTRLRLAQGRPR